MPTKKPTNASKTASKAAGKRTAAKGGKAQVEKRPEGRPTSYRPEYAEQAHKFALLGATDARMAELFGVSESTFYLWKNEHPEFSEAVSKGKEVADAEVAAALFHRAKGYEHPEDDIRTVAMGNGAGSEIVITPTIKRYPPDTAAATLWLKNRQPHIWRDKVDLEHAGPNGGPIQTDGKLDVTVTPAEAYLQMLQGGGSK